MHMGSAFDPAVQLSEYMNILNVGFLLSSLKILLF
jgi:hypothetical protein